MSPAPTLRKKLDLMDEARIARTLARMAHEVAERHSDLSRVALIGIRSRGVPLARRLARALHEATGTTIAVGALDISLYRDDFTSIAAQPIMRGTEIPFSIDGRVVILVDDVLFTGRTVRAALDQLIDFGRPSRIELAVLMDRGHRELPIRADYVGRTLTTRRDEVVEVKLIEEDGRDAVELMERGPVRATASRSLSQASSPGPKKKAGKLRATNGQTPKKRTSSKRRVR